MKGTLALLLAIGLSTVGKRTVLGATWVADPSVTLEKDGIMIKPVPIVGDSPTVASDREMRVQCHEIKVTPATVGESTVEFKGGVKVVGRWRDEFEAKADRMVVYGKGKCLEFHGDAPRAAHLWRKTADDTTPKHVTACRVIWKVDSNTEFIDSGSFQDFSDDRKQASP